MKKLLVLAALLWAVPAVASVEYVVLKSDTLALYAADSSAAVLVTDAKRMWLDISAVPLRGTDMNSECDTMQLSGLADGKVLGSPGVSYASVPSKVDSICTAWVDSVNAIGKAAHLILGIQAREALPVWATTDAGAAISRNQEASAFADSNFVPWIPSAVAGTAATDSAAFNRRLPANAGVGSSEIQAIILPNTGVWSSQRSVRVPLVDAKTGEPFTAQHASFRWRLLVGPANDPIRLRVVLGFEK